MTDAPRFRDAPLASGHCAAGWRGAVPVGRQETGRTRTARRYVPDACTFVARHQRIRTVLEVAIANLATDHRVSCQHCGPRWASVDADRWHGSQSDLELVDQPRRTVRSDGPGGHR